jgi:hypothetical protein
VVDVELGTTTGGCCEEVTVAGVVVGGEIGEGDGGGTGGDISEEDGDAGDAVFGIDGSLSEAEGDGAGDTTIGIACGLSNDGGAVGADFSFAVGSRDFGEFVDGSWRYDGIADPDCEALVAELPDMDAVDGPPLPGLIGLVAELPVTDEVDGPPLPERIGVGLAGGGDIESGGGTGPRGMRESLLLVWVIFESVGFFAG